MLIRLKKKVKLHDRESGWTKTYKTGAVVRVHHPRMGQHNTLTCELDGHKLSLKKGEYTPAKQSELPVEAKGPLPVKEESWDTVSVNDPRVLRKIELGCKSVSVTKSFLYNLLSERDDKVQEVWDEMMKYKVNVVNEDMPDYTFSYLMERMAREE